MSTWSLPAPAPRPENAPLSWLFESWTPGKAWAWLRDGLLDAQDPQLLARLARYALKDLGISPLNLANAWHLHMAPMELPWSVPCIRLPATPDEPWPAEAAALADTPIGLISALVANGWNAFEPFLPMPEQGRDLDTPPPGLRPAWGVEIVMGMIGSTRLDQGWRLALVDQMLRSPHCPSIADLRARRVCKTKKGPAPVSWYHASLRYRLPLVARICIEHGIHDGLWEDWPLHIKPEDRAWWQTCLLENAVEPAAPQAPRHRPRL